MNAPLNISEVLKPLTMQKTLYAFDFDGTLSPIVLSRNYASVPNMTLGYLKQLGQLAQVAVISSRDITELTTRLPVGLNYLIGSLGADHLNLSPKLKEELIQQCKQWTAELSVSDLVEQFGDEIELENKRISIAIHYRRVRQKEIAKIAIVSTINRLFPTARVIFGKSVVNVMPNHSINKSLALLNLIDKTGADRALYIGDDDTDEDIFELEDNRLTTIRVGYKATSKAQYYIKIQGDLNKILRYLIAHINEFNSMPESIL